MSRTPPTQLRNYAGEPLSPGWIPELTLPARLDVARYHAHVSRAELAGACGVRVGDVYRWERHQAEPTPAQVAAWAARCGVDPEWLASGDQLAPWYEPPDPSDGYRWTPEVIQGGRATLVGEAVDAYVAGRRSRGEIGARTAEQLAWRLSTLTALYPALPIAELDRAAVAAWQAAIGHHRPASRRAYLSTVRTFCRWAVLEGLLEADPTVAVARIREPRHQPRALSATQLAQLIEVLPDRRAVLIVVLMARLGLRCVEVARLTLRDYDPDGATLLVSGKGSDERLLPVPPDVAAVLDEWIAGRPPGPLVGLLPQSISVTVTGWMKAAGIKTGAYDGISAHALRHTAASDMLDRCGNVRTVQDLLGHVSLATTERYLRRADLDQMRAALEPENPKR